tara:strand:+ start:936 stop:1451 length:516 start_codon:yes stop_codon:yes gene_type:complete
MSRIFVNPSEVELQEESVISIKRVSKATTGGRRMRFNSLVAVGDGNGHVGIGFGKANDVAMAVSKAKENAKKRIIKVPIFKGTIPHRMDIKKGSVRLMLQPAGPGTGIIAGGPVREVLSQLGVKNILSKNTGSTNVINVVRALEHGLLTMKDPLMIAKQRGITVKQLFDKV